STWNGCRRGERGFCGAVLVRRSVIAGGRRQWGVGPAENACHVATIFPAPGADARDRKARNRDISGLDVHEQGRRQHCLIQRSEQRGLPVTTRAAAEDLRARPLCVACVSYVNFHRSLPHIEIERRSQRPAGATVAVATERTANGFGISTVLNRDRECDGGIARAGVGGRIALVVPEV